MARADVALASDGCNAEAAEALHHCTVAAAALRGRFRADDAAVGLTARLRGGVKRKQKKEQRLVLGRRADQLSLELDAVLTAVLGGQLCWRMTRWGCQVSCCGCWSFGRSPRD